MRFHDIVISFIRYSQGLQGKSLPPPCGQPGPGVEHLQHILIGIVIIKVGHKSSQLGISNSTSSSVHMGTGHEVPLGNICKNLHNNLPDLI